MKTHHTHNSLFSIHTWMSIPLWASCSHIYKPRILSVSWVKYWGLNRLINISWLAWIMSSNLQIVIINRASFKHAKVVRFWQFLPSQTVWGGHLAMASCCCKSDEVQCTWGFKSGITLPCIPWFACGLSAVFPMKTSRAWPAPLSWRQEETPAEAQHHPQGSLWMAERTDLKRPPWLLGQDPRGSKSIPEAKEGHDTKMSLGRRNLVGGAWADGQLISCHLKLCVVKSIWRESVKEKSKSWNCPVLGSETCDKLNEINPRSSCTSVFHGS